MLLYINTQEEAMSPSAACWFIVVFVFAFTNVNSELYRGDKCYHEKKATNGTCIILEQCQSAINDFALGVFPQNCGFENRIVIVCCPESAPVPKPVITTTESPPKVPVTVGEKIKQACNSYKQLAYKKVIVPTLVGDAEEELQENCPWEVHGVSVIYYGEEAKAGEFPHMALIGYGSIGEYEWKCGGSLISEKFVLTAAHCKIERILGPAKIVRLGDLNYSSPYDDQYVQEINVIKLHGHPGYKRPPRYNDLALLELEKAAKLNVFVKPICIYPHDSVNVNNGIITGWGVTEKGTHSPHLLKAGVERFTFAECNKSYVSQRRTLPRGVDDTIQICYGSNSTQKDSCQGDSGGPIQIYNRDVFCSYYIFGVTSFGHRCGLKTIPGIYVKIYTFIEWIENIVWP